jgi:hypothetical protein
MTNDMQVWEAYPQYRWIFNKLELAMRFGYKCGPACIPIKKKGDYIVRPIYNLRGCGIGAKKINLDPKIHTEDMTFHKFIPPGHFWCEYFMGSHFSIDYKRENKIWTPFSAMIGKHESEDNLIKFKVWEKIPIPKVNLPNFVEEIDVEYINIESKDDKIFEIHLRPGNKEIWDLPMGTKLYPSWNNEDNNDKKSLTFIPNTRSDRRFYQANGYLSDIRKGFYVELPK